MADPQGKGSTAMPIMSSEEMHLHDAVAFWESVQAALANAGLLKAAMGMEPDESRKIVDVDPESLPKLPPDHSQYYRQLETLLRIKTQNKSNRRQRYAIIMQQRTSVYSMMYQSAKPNAPIFARELREACDYTRDGVAGGC